MNTKCICKLANIIVIYPNVGHSNGDSHTQKVESGSHLRKNKKHFVLFGSKLEDLRKQNENCKHDATY